MKRINLLLTFVLTFGIGFGLAKVVISELDDFESYLMKLDIGGVKIDASQSIVLDVPGKLISNNRMGVASNPGDLSLKVGGDVDIDGQIKIKNSNTMIFPGGEDVLFVKSGAYNYVIGNIVATKVGGAHLNIGAGGAGMLNINGNLRVYGSSSIGCDADNVGVIKWNGSRLIVCEAKTDFYGRPINGQYEWHQISR